MFTHPGRSSPQQQFIDPKGVRSMTEESPTDATTARERLEMHLAQALTRAQSPDVQHHLEAALEECRQLPPTPLVECPLCGRVGLPERVQNHCCTDPPERLGR